MRSIRVICTATLVLSAFGLGGATGLVAGETVVGERLDPSAYGPSYVESMQAAVDRDRLAPPPENSKDRQGRNGVWVVPSRGATTFPHSEEHNAVNKWGDTRMGISFPGLVDVHGAYFAGQADEGAWTTGIRVIGYRDGQVVRQTDWLHDIGPEPRWLAMKLHRVDRIEIVSVPVLFGAGWYGMDDLTYSLATEADEPPGQRLVVDFDDLPYRSALTGSGYAGLTWETGTGDFSGSDSVHGPVIPPGGRSGEPPAGGTLPEASPMGGTLPALVATYQGVIRGDAGSMSFPPDSDGAIGPNHYVETVNRNFAVYDKTTGAELMNILLGTFLPGSNGDPRVLFDHHSGRWVVIVTDFSAGANIYLAVSTTDDPTGGWFKTSFLTAQGSDAGKWPDYPTLGVDANGIYTAAYMIGGSSGMTIFAIDKAPLIDPSPSLGTITAFRGLPWEGAIQPVHGYGTPSGEYLVSTASSSSIRVRRIEPPLTSPTLIEVGFVPVPSFSDPPNAPAMGSSTPLNTVDDRLMMSVYRNGSLWTCHTIGVGGRAGCRWYEIDAAAASLIQSGTVADTSLYYFFPAIMVNQAGHVAMGFTGSNSSQYAACYYTGRFATDPPGEMAPPMMYKAGTGPQNNIDGYGRNRWGDYSYTTLDPVDQGTFWTIQEYGHATDIWGTYIAVVTTGPMPPIADDIEVNTAVSMPVTITLVAHDDGEPDPPAALTYIVTSLPAHGELTDPGNGLITSAPYTLTSNGAQLQYQPEVDYHDVDSFQYKANDGGTPPEGGDSDAAVVTVTMGGPQWDPMAHDASTSTAVSVPADVTLDASDPNGDPLTYFVEMLPTDGTLSDPGAGAITSVPYELVGGGNVVMYQPPCGESLTDAFTFSVRDQSAGSNVATVSVTVSASGSRVVYDFSLAGDPGWSTQGLWAFGQPNGGGSGDGDPTGGHTGSNVFGYNLDGDYTNNMPVYYLTMPPLNCAGASNVELRFWKWLGIESSLFDHAKLQVSDSGLFWTTIWQHEGETVSDTSWSQMVFDISTLADGKPAVFIRWGMGTTDGSNTYPGWNLDDIEIWADIPVVPGDFTGDGLVNLDDFAVFESCLSGPVGGTAPGCLCVDLDGDSDVDLLDFAGLQEAFVGP